MCKKQQGYSSNMLANSNANDEALKRLKAEHDQLKKEKDKLEANYKKQKEISTNLAMKLSQVQATNSDKGNPSQSETSIKEATARYVKEANDAKSESIRLADELKVFERKCRDAEKRAKTMQEDVVVVAAAADRLFFSRAAFLCSLARNRSFEDMSFHDDDDDGITTDGTDSLNGADF